MNAQKQWKKTYREMISDLQNGFDICASVDRDEMRLYRREAALERRCAMLERQNKRLSELLDLANYAVWQSRL